MEASSLPESQTKIHPEVFLRFQHLNLVNEHSSVLAFRGGLFDGETSRRGADPLEHEAVNAASPSGNPSHSLRLVVSTVQSGQIEVPSVNFSFAFMTDGVRARLGGDRGLTWRAW